MVFSIHCVLSPVMIYTITRNICLISSEKLLDMLACLFKSNIIKSVTHRWPSFKHKEINIHFSIDFFTKTQFNCLFQIYFNLCRIYNSIFKTWCIMINFNATWLDILANKACYSFNLASKGRFTFIHVYANIPTISVSPVMHDLIDLDPILYKINNNNVKLATLCRYFFIVCKL